MNLYVIKKIVNYYRDELLFHGVSFYFFRYLTHNITLWYIPYGDLVIGYRFACHIILCDQASRIACYNQIVILIGHALWAVTPLWSDIQGSPIRGFLPIIWSHASLSWLPASDGLHSNAVIEFPCTALPPAKQWLGLLAVALGYPVSTLIRRPLTSYMVRSAVRPETDRLQHGVVSGPWPRAPAC